MGFLSGKRKREEQSGVPILGNLIHDEQLEEED